MSCVAPDRLALSPGSDPCLHPELCLCTSVGVPSRFHPWSRVPEHEMQGLDLLCKGGAMQTEPNPNKSPGGSGSLEGRQLQDRRAGPSQSRHVGHLRAL